MLRSMFAGVSGLRSHQTMVDVVGNNIANVNTTGYKSSSVVFQDLLSQVLNGAGAPDAMNGGTNPAAVGLGVKVRSEEHTSELQSLMRISYAVFCLKKKKNNSQIRHRHNQK